MSIRDSVPNPDQSAVVEGETAPTDAEVGMPPGPSQVPEDSERQARDEEPRREEDAREEAEVGIDPDTGMPNTAGGVP